MDALPAPRCSKRKAEDKAEDNGPKRPMPSPDSGEVRQYGLTPRPPRISVNEEHLQRPISEEQLMELLHYSALGRATGHSRRLSWCSLRRQKRLKAVCVAVVDHVNQRDFYEHYLSLPHLRTKYSTRVTLSSSSTNLVSEIFSSEVHMVHPPSPKKQESPHSHKGLRSHPVIFKFGTERRGLTAYLLSEEERKKRHYPVIGCPGCEDFVSTDCDAEVTDSSPLFGLDCEMCLTDQGSELTRVSLVDSSGTCVLDELVKPRNKIRNYLTQFSGVTQQMLKPVETTLSQVQSRLKSLLPRDAVLVGHSLENDLRALKMVHPHVIDTSLLYRRHLGQRFKLKVLAETLLQKQIQTEDRRGHDPCEDASAALELAQYFISKGPLKIVEEHQEELWGVPLSEPESTPPTAAEHTSSRFAEVLQACGRSVAFFGRRWDICLHLSKQLWLSSDRQVLQAFRDQPKCPAFSVLQFFSSQTGGAQAVLKPQACPPPLRNMCVVFVGPLPPHSSEEDVRRVLCCCGPLRSVRIIRTALRVHAEVHFALPEGALLALSTLSGLSLHGHCVKVQRPVSETTLDVDVTLEALQSDPVTQRLLYVTSICPHLTPLLQASTHTSGHTGEDDRRDDPRDNRQDIHRDSDRSSPVPINGQRGLREDALLDTFGRFGPVIRIITPPHTGGATHAYIEFVSVDSRQAALSASQELLQLNYLLCPALMPLHLSAPVSRDTVDRARDRPEDAQGDMVDQERTNGALTSIAEAEWLRKLDRRLGKLFRCLPEGALSVVVLRGNQNAPGLCFVEIKKTS
ncbi:RNA exonuclease 5 [Boleophthalmus pectinirostris]|uniref:RNA exonuclease 5 n=1 Tax=Boleophthalmus pectinirostris TaxID=150288 RepID=UPI00242F6318|nr:RNA exonuclease 5 [Boleophthalmus pectinirostris]